MGNFVNKIAEEIQKMTGVDAQKLMDLELLHPLDARKWLVKKKYYAMSDGNKTYTEIKGELSLEYGLSISTIEKLIYRK
jgi:hypothetical protein